MSTYAFHYDYDAAGNRTKQVKDSVPTFYHYDAANQLTEKETVGTGWTYFEYDANGSMVKEHDQAADKTTCFEYGDHGLVTKITPPAGSPTEFFYDARLQRYAIDWAGTVSYYAWDGMNQLVEKNADLTTAAQHTHGQTPIEGIGSVVTTKRGSDHQYPHYDHRGSLFELEDTGAADLDAEYNAFGEELSRTGAASTRFGYQGTAWMRLPVGGEVYLLSPHRIYLPKAGIFLQRDPLRRLRPRSSAYQYVRGNPLRYLDVAGLKEETCDERVWKCIDGTMWLIQAVIGAGGAKAIYQCKNKPDLRAYVKGRVIRLGFAARMGTTANVKFKDLTACSIQELPGQLMLGGTDVVSAGVDFRIARLSGGIAANEPYAQGGGKVELKTGVGAGPLQGGFAGHLGTESAGLGLYGQGGPLSGTIGGEYSYEEGLKQLEVETEAGFGLAFSFMDSYEVYSRKARRTSRRKLRSSRARRAPAFPKGSPFPLPGTEHLYPRWSPGTSPQPNTATYDPTRPGQGLVWH